MSHIVDCFVCNKNIKITPSRFKNRNNFFCNKKCESEFKKSQNEKIKILCRICGKEFYRKKSYVNKRNKHDLTCSYACMGEYRKIKYLGDYNPNKKYNFNRRFFENIDTEIKAYILGWIASDGTLTSSGKIEIALKTVDDYILEWMKNQICKNIELKYRKNLASISFSSTDMVTDICKHLKIIPGKKSKIVRFPLLKSDNLSWCFLRGYFDGDGTVRNPHSKRSLDCSIISNSFGMLCDIQSFCKIDCSVSEKSARIYFYGANALKFLNCLYGDSKFHLKRKFEFYKIWAFRKKMVFVTSLDKTERGTGGFGSTGA
jgi:hypothetical protein